jgi:EAL domain-containing protein (putative c-di-GMP-specific phosphodiesterase class I)
MLSEKHILSDPIHQYHEHIPSLVESLTQNGSLALILLDVTPFNAIEEQYGIHTYRSIHQQLFTLLLEQSGKEYRKRDILTLEGPEGVNLLIFLSPRHKESCDSFEQLKTLRLTLIEHLIPKLLRTSLPYLKHQPEISIGYALGINNSILDPHHIILRTIREARHQAKFQESVDDMESMQQLKELILQENINTVYQPILDIKDGTPIGYEALSRGGLGTSFPTADLLFDTAIRHNLQVELDRICRKRALLLANRLPENTKIFINTLPTIMHDPEFQKHNLVDSLKHSRITPNRIVIEVTERLAIDNLSLFEDAMTYYTNMGMTLAVDDVGSGYSGLQIISKLKPAYLKLDKSLVRAVSRSKISQEMLKAIVVLGRSFGAKLIAEGIENVDQLNALRSIGIDYGQGFFLGRPHSMIDI